MKLAVFLVLLFAGSPARAEELAVVSDGNLIPAAGAGESITSFSARDSLIYHFGDKTMELRGKARIVNKATIVTAPKILVDLATSTINAYGGSVGTSGQAEPAMFSNPEGSFNSDRITYTIDSGSGETTNLTSSSAGVIIGGRQVNRLENGELVIRDGTFTTCDDPEPHYWISSDYMRVIPGSRIIARPFIMYIRPELFSKRLPAIPILPLPFMVFPLQGARSSGVVIPRLSHDSDRGLVLTDLGYFWAINDHIDLKIEGDIAFNGSWRLAERFRYNSRYAFSGLLEGEYERYFKGDSGDADYEEYNSWYVRFEHHQDFDPATALDAKLRFQGGDRSYDLNAIDAETIINEQAESYASYAKTFDDENSIATVSYQRTDDLRSSDESQLASAGFYQNRYYPFRSGRLGSLDDWRDRLSITSGAALRGLYESEEGSRSWQYVADAGFEAGYFTQYSEGSKALFTQGLSLQGRLLDDDIYGDNRYGMRLQLPFRMQSTLFQRFNINAGVYFSRYLVGNDLLKSFDGTEVITAERTGARGFSTWHASADVSARLYASAETPFLESLTGLTALRHTLIPVISWTWNPDFTGTDFDYYSTVFNGIGYERYSRFEHSAYTDIPSGQNTVGLTLKNLIHGRLGSPERNADGSHRTLHLLSLTASAAYNFAAETCRWSPLLITATSSAVSPNFLMNAGALYDFYGYDPLTGDRSDQIDAADRGGLLRFVKGYLNMSLNIEGKNRNGSAGRPEAMRAEQAIFRERFNAGDFSDIDFGIPWRLRMSLYLLSDRTDPLAEAETTTLLNMSAKVALSRNWQIGINTGYEIERNEFIFPMLQLYRDLHCWQVGFQWVPSGEYNSYYFQIGLKAPQLQDIRFRTGGRTRGYSD
jgi:hypothetical protein